MKRQCKRFWCAGYSVRPWCVNHLNNRSRARGDDHLGDYDGRLVGIAKLATGTLFSLMTITTFDQICAKKFEQFTIRNPMLQMKRDEFLHLFNNHLDICVLPEPDKRHFMSGQECVDKRQPQGNHQSKSRS